MDPQSTEAHAVIREIDACRICGSRNLRPILDLGNIHISGFPAPGEADPPAIPLEMLLCEGECGLVQLRHTTDPELLYRTYYYRSGVNQTMRDALRNITESAERLQPLEAGDVVVDIGSNDNTLLKSYTVPGLRRIGFEPSRNIGAEAARDRDIEVINDYFSARPELAGKASVITSIAMFYDLDDPHAFVRDIASTLEPEGLWVLQLAYLRSVLERNGFDGICHEHLSYYSLRTLEYLLGQHGFQAVDAELIDLNEGSIRIYVRRAGVGEPSARLQELRDQEAALGFDTVRPYQEFRDRVDSIKRRMLELLRGAAAEGKTVHGYGASTKGNTLLQYFGIDRSLVQAIWERQSQKWGFETVQTRIPIIGEDEGRRQRPDYLLVLPWHFAAEFIEREREYLQAGGRMIIPLPEFRVVEAKDLPPA